MAKNPKMVMCRNCGTPMAASAKLCPACGAKNKKPFYKRAWFIILAVIVVAGVISSVGNRDEKSERADKESDALMTVQTEDSWEPAESPSVVARKQNAVEEMEETEEKEKEKANSSAKEEAEAETKDSSSAEPPEQDAAAEAEEEPKAEETEAEPEQAQEDDSAIDPDFKAAMDSYEAFMDEYIAFMEKYKANPGDTALPLDYTNYVSKYAQFVDDFSKWESADMNAAELAYYAEVSSRVSRKLLAVSQ